MYWGRVTFPPQYPFKPPSIQMVTPTGRFATNTKLCLRWGRRGVWRGGGPWGGVGGVEVGGRVEVASALKAEGGGTRAREAGLGADGRAPSPPPPQPLPPLRTRLPTPTPASPHTHPPTLLHPYYPRAA